MERRRLGRTGHQSSVAVLGGAAFWACTPEEAEAAFHLALDRGVNHLDIAPSYGQAEVVVGPHVPAVRDRLFVAGKSDRANPDGVRAHLERTLERLGTDHLDLYQLHGVTSLDVLDERARPRPRSSWPRETRASPASSASPATTSAPRGPSWRRCAATTWTP